MRTVALEADYDTFADEPAPIPTRMPGAAVIHACAATSTTPVTYRVA